MDVIYDELGINLCTTFDLGINIPVDYPTATVGISLVVQSLYFASYKVPTEGKVDTPKGSTIPSQETDCMCFVEGDVLNLAIKPLELGCH